MTGAGITMNTISNLRKEKTLLVDSTHLPLIRQGVEMSIITKDSDGTWAMVKVRIIEPTWYERLLRRIRWKI